MNPPWGIHVQSLGAMSTSTLVLFCLLTIALIPVRQAFDHNTCSFTTHNDTIEAYFINLEHRRDRRMVIDETLKRMQLVHHRIRAVKFEDIFLPPDVNRTWQTDSCVFESEWKPTDALGAPVNHTSNMQIYASSLCARPRFVTEIACTASHLMAIYKACHDSSSHSRYALIIEDDVFVPLDIDWRALIATAPQGFGFLQLFSQHAHLTSQYWAEYKRRPDWLWSPNTLWCTGMYLIDKHVLAPIIKKLVTLHEHRWWQLRLIAPQQRVGKQPPICNPTQCCDEAGKYIGRLPCVNSQVAADWFLYSIAPSYVLKVPISVLGSEAGISNVQPKEMTRSNFSEQSKQYIMEMVEGKVPLPSFARRACGDSLLV
mmetsp:Transcript_27769/g.46682  ORF Transcript_27769/g.46682 Transcript_27769/m.46682 type:complete len:371 (+) Transcript_27769:2-1114(+)